MYVALAPTYPDCDESDLRATLNAAANLDPVTIFHEPINVRAENVARIQQEAAALGLSLRTDVFASRESWQRYAIDSLRTVEGIATKIGVQARLHLWPDKSLGSRETLARQPVPREFQEWLQRSWNRVSEWPA